MAPRPSRHSSSTTPRSFRISALSKVTPWAQSSRIWNAFRTMWALSVGTLSWYTVSSNEVPALRSAPNCMPMDSM